MYTSVEDASQNEDRARLLLLYAEPLQLAALVQRLPSERFDVVTCPVFSSKGWLDDLRPDLVLLAPTADAEQMVATCQSARADTDCPLIVLSELTDEVAITRSLSTGIDEYLALPIGDLELLARIDAVLRRAQRHYELEETRRVGNLLLSMSDHTVLRGGRRVVLSPIEFRLLLCLASAPGKVFTHETLMSRVWGAEYVDARHYLYLYIRYLREKLEDDPTRPQLIVSEWGVGYSLRVSPAPQSHEGEYSSAAPGHTAP